MRVLPLVAIYRQHRLNTTGPSAPLADLPTPDPGPAAPSAPPEIPEPSPAPAPFDPTLRYYRGQTIRITDLVPNDSPPLIEERTFEDCILLGPAMVSPIGIGTFQECGFEGRPEEIVFEVPAERHIIRGVIGLKDCTFRRCDFRGIGFLGHADLMAMLRDIPFNPNPPRYPR